MKKPTGTIHALCAFGVLACLSGTAGATTLFTENFEAISAPPGNFNGGPGGQHITTHDMVHTSNLAGWSEVGGGTVHAVDTNNTWTGGVLSGNPQNWGVMFWQDNVITQTVGISGSNDSGTPYSIDFLAAGGVYHAPSQVNNGTTDNLLIEILRASDSAVLHSFNHPTAAPIGVGNLGLAPGNFGYTGDGSGDILFRIGPGNANQGRFQGTIDDLSLTRVPEPGVSVLAGVAGLGLLLRRRRKG